MALRLTYVLLFSACAFGLGIAAPAFPVEEKCGANAEFLTCGSACVPNCANPQPTTMCTLQCVIGCFCKEGYLKNSNGECVRLEECEAHHEIPMQFPQTEPKCPDNEFFNPCGSACAPTCANPDPSPICTKNCVVGCFCKEGHLRDASGVCVPHTKCNAAEAMQLFAYPPELSQCKENEMFLRCGTACPATCANPHPSPVCTRNCVIGCFCKPGFLKNENGVCVHSETCGVPAAEAMPMQAPVCGDNEEYRQCKGCDGTCKNPNPICPRICVPGCACKEGHLRNDAGKCVETRECSPKVQPQSFMMLPPVQQCQEGEEYRQCKGCDGTCKNPNPICPRICIPGCACKQGLLRNDAGKCVETRECSPKVQPESFQQCQENEEFRQCKGCDGTCKNPNPLCPRICRPGCACLKGYLRNDAGKCVETRECSPKVQPESFMMLPPIPKCNANEIFLSCGTACPATCANPHPSPVCTKNCVIGCFCKEGLLKNAQGECVEAANC
jgi:hypothetical protein